MGVYVVVELIPILVSLLLLGDLHNKDYSSGKRCEENE